MEAPRIPSWMAAVLAWVIAVVVVAGAFALWRLAHGQSVPWELVRKAALMALPLAVVLAWRGRGRRN